MSVALTFGQTSELLNIWNIASTLLSVAAGGAVTYYASKKLADQEATRKRTEDAIDRSAAKAEALKLRLGAICLKTADMCSAIRQIAMTVQKAVEDAKDLKIVDDPAMRLGAVSGVNFVPQRYDTDDFLAFIDRPDTGVIKALWSLSDIHNSLLVVLADYSAVRNAVPERVGMKKWAEYQNGQADLSELYLSDGAAVRMLHLAQSLHETLESAQQYAEEATKLLNVETRTLIKDANARFSVGYDRVPPTSPKPLRLDQPSPRQAN